MNEQMNRILNMRTKAEFDGLLAKLGVNDPDLLQTICTLALEQLPAGEARAFVLTAADEYDKFDHTNMNWLDKSQRRPPVFREVEDWLSAEMLKTAKEISAEAEAAKPWWKKW